MSFVQKERGRVGPGFPPNGYCFCFPGAPGPASACTLI